MYTKLSRLLVVAVVVLAAPLIRPEPAAAAMDWTSRHISVYQGRNVGLVEFNGTWTYATVSGRVCLTDTLANGKGVYVRLKAAFLVNGSWQYESGGEFGTGGSSCYPFTVARPGGDTRYQVVHLVAAMGNAAGSLREPTVTDVIPSLEYDDPGVSKYPVWQETALRRGGPECRIHPSAANCSTIVRYLQDGEYVVVDCQTWGAQTVGGNPYWLAVHIPGDPSYYGWIPSYPLDYPKRWVDFVPICIP